MWAIVVDGSTAGQPGSRWVWCLCVSMRVRRGFDHELIVGGHSTNITQAQTAHGLFYRCVCGKVVCVFASFALKAKTTSSCDCFAEHKKILFPYFCGWLFTRQTTLVILDSCCYRFSLMLFRIKWATLSPLFIWLVFVYKHPLRELTRLVSVPMSTSLHAVFCTEG